MVTQNIQIKIPTTLYQLNLCPIQAKSSKYNLSTKKDFMLTSKQNELTPTLDGRARPCIWYLNIINKAYQQTYCKDTASFMNRPDYFKKPEAIADLKTCIYYCWEWQNTLTFNIFHECQY